MSENRQYALAEEDTQELDQSEEIIDGGEEEDPYQCVANTEEAAAVELADIKTQVVVKN